MERAPQQCVSVDAGFSRNTPVPLVATAHYYMVVRYLVEAAAIIAMIIPIKCVIALPGSLI